MSDQQKRSACVVMASGLIGALVLAGCMVGGPVRDCEAFSHSCLCEPMLTGVGTPVDVCDTTFLGGAHCCNDPSMNSCQCVAALICVSSGSLGCSCGLTGPAVPSQIEVPSCSAASTGACCLGRFRTHCDCDDNVPTCPAGETEVPSCTPESSDSCGSGLTSVTSC
jgi:hypothetical protein